VTIDGIIAVTMSAINKILRWFTQQSSMAWFFHQSVAP
jgi:hypothetical protein